jgi:hypothetical protein
LSVISPKTTGLNPGAPGTALAGAVFRKTGVKRLTNKIAVHLRTRNHLPCCEKMILIHKE